MNVSLGKHWEDYVARQVESGNFNNASEVVHDALGRQQEYFAKLEALRQDVAVARASIEAGKVSHAGPTDIKEIVAARRASR